MSELQDQESINISAELNQLVKKDPQGQDSLMQFGERLENLAFQAAAAGKIDNVINQLPKDDLTKLIAQYGNFEVMIDEQFVNDILENRANQTEDYRFADFYRRLANFEYTLAELKKGNRILQAGSGPYPGTAISLYKQFGTPVTCIEIDQKRANQSRLLLSKLGLLGPNAISVENYDASAINPEKYDLVIIAAMIQKEPTLNFVYNLVRLATPGGHSPEKVILREPYGAGKLFYPPIQGKTEFHHFNEVGNSSNMLSLNKDRILSRLFLVKPLGRVNAGLEEPSIAQNLQPV